MGSEEPITFSKRVVKPDKSIKSMNFCNVWVQNDKYDCNLLDFMGSKWISGSCKTYVTHVSVRAISLPADITFPQNLYIYVFQINRAKGEVTKIRY